VGVAVGVTVGVAVGDGVTVGVAVGDGVTVGVAEGVAVAEPDGVGVGPACATLARATTEERANRRRKANLVPVMTNPWCI